MISITYIAGRRNTNVLIRYRHRHVHRNVVAKHEDARQHGRARLTVIRRVRERLRMRHLIPILFRFSNLNANVMNSTSAAGVVRYSNRMGISELVVLMLSNRLRRVKTLRGRQQSTVHPRRQTANVRAIKVFVLVFNGSLLTLFLLFLLYFGVYRNMLLNGYFTVTSHNGRAVLSRRNADTVPLSNARVIHSRGRNLHQVLLSFHRVIITLPLRNLVTGNRSLVRSRSIPLDFGHRKGDGAGLRA